MLGTMPAVRETALSSPASPTQRPCAPSRVTEKASSLEVFPSVSSGQALPLDPASVQCSPQLEPPAPLLGQQVTSLNQPSSPFLPPASHPKDDSDLVGWASPAAAPLLCLVQDLGNTGASPSAPAHYSDQIGNLSTLTCVHSRALGCRLLLASLSPAPINPPLSSRKGPPPAAG